MKLLVMSVSVIVVALGISIVIHPKMLKEMLHFFMKKRWLWPVSLGRMIMGVFFIYVADDTSMPVFLGIFGIVLVLAGISVPLLGSHRVESMSAWWMAQKDYSMRLMGLILLLLGITLALSTL